MLIMIIKEGNKISAREIYYSRHGGRETRAYVQLGPDTDYSRLEHGDVLEADEIGRRKTRDGLGSVVVVALKEYATSSYSIEMQLGRFESAELRTARRAPSGNGSAPKCEKVDLAQAKEILGAEYENAVAKGYWSCGDKIDAETARSLRRV